MREPADALQPDWRSAAEIVRSDPDVAHPRGVNKAHNVIGDVDESGLGRRSMFRLEFRELSLGIGSERRLAISVARSAKPVTQSLRNEPGHESRHDEPA